jgi:hypothetical protein
MNIDILYIATGKYKLYWALFYKSCENYFLTSHVKNYFIFTDDPLFFNQDGVITLIKIADYGWPEATLFRFNFFSQSFKLFKGDYIYFFNSNYQFLDYVNEVEIIPLDTEVVVLTWGSYLGKTILDYETMKCNKSIISNLKINKTKFYIQGGIFGAKNNEFKNLTDFCFKNIEIDYSHGVIPKNNDEFYLNYYLNERPIKVINHLIGMPEEWGIKSKGIFRNKENDIGFYRLLLKKYKTNGLLLTVKILIKKIFVNYESN